MRAAWLVGIAVAVGLIATGAPARADAVDLSTWTAESYPAVSGFGAGVWTVSGDGSSVTQSVNGQPTMFFSDFTAHGTDTTGTIRVSGSDDDFIGFVLGFDPGDASSTGANYLLIDWKRGNQSFDFGAPSSDPGGTASAGLAVSRVEGIPTADEFWQHTTYGTDGGLTELARATTLGSTGWTAGTDYDFEFVFLPGSLEIWVNGTQEFDLTGTFENGRMGFYNFSQAGVTYSAFDLEVVTIPEPTTLAMFGLGAAGLALLRRRGRAL